MTQGGSANMTKLGVNIAVARAVPLSSAAGSPDFVTLNHNLGKTPHMVNVVPRSVVNTPSGGTPGPVVDSYNGSIIIVRLPVADGAGTNVLLDCYAIFAHSIVQ